MEITKMGKHFIKLTTHAHEASIGFATMGVCIPPSCTQGYIEKNIDVALISEWSKATPSKCFACHQDTYTGKFVIVMESGRTHTVCENPEVFLKEIK